MPHPRLLMTPDTHPGHPIIGREFHAYCPYDRKVCRYLCDSFDPDQGFWMTRVDAPHAHRQDQDGRWRRNVSGRAIDATYHVIYDLGDGILRSRWGRVSDFEGESV